MPRTRLARQSRVYGREGAHVTEQWFDEAGVTQVHVYGTDDAGHVDAWWSVENDEAGRLVDLVGPTVGGVDAMVASYGYDVRGRLSGVEEATIGAFGFGYDAAGRRASLTRPNGAITTTSYDESGRTEAISTVNGLGALVHEISTTWDERGLPDTQTDQEGTHVYTHDIDGRLVGVDHPDGTEFGDEFYAYDQADRRTATHRDPAPEVLFNDADQLLQDALYTYAYDDEGRRVSRTHRVSGEVTTYTYNALDQIVGLEEASKVWTFVYDAQDLRVLVKAEAGGVETYGEAFVYDLNGTVRASYVSSAQLSVAFLAGDGFGEVLARLDAAGVEYALRDRLGTTVGWLDQPGAMSELVLRDAYGVRQALPDKVVPFGYTGHAENPTGLAWGRARYYYPPSGAWMSEDADWRMSRYSYGDAAPSWISDQSGNGTTIQYTVFATRTLGFVTIQGESAIAIHLAVQAIVRVEGLILIRAIQVGTF